MASTLSHSLNLPFSPLHTSLKPCIKSLKPFINPSKPTTLSLSSTPSNRHRRCLIITRATENGPKTDKEPETDNNDELSEVGEEIKKAMKERELDGGSKDGFWSGVVEEIGMIEWPEFRNVLGTTGVVLAVIAASSFVLLTLNAVLAQISDQLFLGRGVQDFFAG